jgi:hypothetical protein
MRLRSSARSASAPSISIAIASRPDQWTALTSETSTIELAGRIVCTCSVRVRIENARHAITHKKPSTSSRMASPTSSVCRVTTHTTLGQNNNVPVTTAAANTAQLRPTREMRV